MKLHDATGNHAGIIALAAIALVLTVAQAARAARADTRTAAQDDLRRYSIILERQPFGAPPPEPVAPPAPPGPAVPGPDAFIKSLRMCAITENPVGLRVGLVDIRSKPPKTYFLYVGDEEDGILLVDADYGEERALLRKGAEEYWIDMDNRHTGSSPSPTVVASTSGSSPQRRPSYAERLRMKREREAERIRKMAERPKLTTEELESKLREYQMDIIRKGEPPLPIPLTKEMDDQLVSEGVLPPL